MKKVAYIVIGVHCFLLFWMALWKPAKLVEKKPLTVRTVVKIPPPTPIPTPVSPVAQVVKAPLQPKKKSSPKKKFTKKPIPKKPKTPAIPQNLVKELRQSIAKIDEKPQKVLTHKPLKIPTSIATLKVDKLAEEVEDGYVTSLVECLQSTLNLPEVGEVKLELTLSADGHFVHTKVVKSGSEHNQKFLEGALRTIRYPSFTGQLKQEKEHTFVLSFYNS